MLLSGFLEVDLGGYETCNNRTTDKLYVSFMMSEIGSSVPPIIDREIDQDFYLGYF